MPLGEHFVKRRVEFHETDRVGMVHFSNYFQYMDSAVGEFFRALALPGPLTNYWGGTKDDELDWPYVNASCDYKRPLQFDDFVDIQIWIKKIGTKSLTFGISFKKDGVELAQGQCVVVCSKGIQGTPQTVEIPAFIRERLAIPSWAQAAS